MLHAQHRVHNNMYCDTCSSIGSRFAVPDGYQRVKVNENTFAHYLQNLDLKKVDAEVTYFDGRKKAKRGVYCSVVDMDIDPLDLQQCADAVMRLRAEFLYAQKQYDKIHFNFISDGKPRYYTNYANGDYSYEKFRKYLRYVFSYANTRSLHGEMKTVAVTEMQIGDVFIQTGNPFGHAVVVVDMAVHIPTGDKIFMLAQSYMPAQETQILINPQNKILSPWYVVDTNKVFTPEWTFTSNDLRRFKE